MSIGSRAVLTLCLAAALPAAAQSVVSTGESFVRSSLLVGAQDGSGSRDAGLELSVRPGWKTYWRNPGEAGIPPSFDWSGSSNLADVEVAWPRPEVFDSFGLRTIGYSGTVVLPLRLTPKDPERPIALSLDMTLGVCRDICVLEEATLSADIAAGSAGGDAAAIAAAEALVPAGGADAGLTRASCRVAGSGEDRSFTATLEFDKPLARPHVALEGPGESWFQQTTTVHDGNRLEIGSTLSLSSETAWVDRSELRITVLDTDFAADIRGCAAG